MKLVLKITLGGEGLEPVSLDLPADAPAFDLGPRDYRVIDGDKVRDVLLGGLAFRPGGSRKALGSFSLLNPKPGRR